MGSIQNGLHSEILLTWDWERSEEARIRQEPKNGLQQSIGGKRQSRRPKAQTPAKVTHERGPDFRQRSERLDCPLVLIGEHR